MSTDRRRRDAISGGFRILQEVIPRTVVPERVQRLAALQGGALSHEQVVDLGVSGRVIHRLVTEQTWRAVSRGLYATTDDHWLQRAWSGILLGGPQAVLGRSSAAFLQGLVKDPPPQISVFSGTHQVRRDQRWRFVRAHRQGAGEPARTRAAQTVVDLAAELEADAIATLLAEALRQRGVRPQVVLAILRDTPRHPRRALLVEILADVSAGAESPLEVRYVRDVEKAHRLPTAVRQAQFGRTRGDALYEEYGVLVKLDASAYHRGLAASIDMERDNTNLLRGGDHAQIRLAACGVRTVPRRAPGVSRAQPTRLARGGARLPPVPSPLAVQLPTEVGIQGNSEGAAPLRVWLWKLPLTISSRPISGTRTRRRGTSTATRTRVSLW